MKLLIITRERDGERAYGLGKTMGNIAKQLQKQGHHVHYFCAEGWGDHEAKRIKQIKQGLSVLVRSDMLQSAWAERLLQGWRSGKKAHDENITHVWFQDPWLVAGFYIHTLLHGRHRIRQKWGVSEHGMGSFVSAVAYDGLHIAPRISKWLKKYERMVLASALWVFSPTQAALKKLQSDLDYVSVPKHWSAIGYGLPDIYQMSKKDGRNMLGWDDDTIYILSVGRITPAKGMELVVEAYAYALKFTQQKIKLVILGHGDHGWLEAIANAYGVEVEIKFVDDVVPYLRSADIYLGGSRVESFGYANLEALCASIACIVLDGEANREVVSSGGWIVDNLDKALVEMIEQPSRRESWQKNAKEYTRMYPTWKEVSVAYEECLDV